MEFEITSPGNERIKRLVRLKDRGPRDAEGVFVVEGQRLITRAMAAGLVPVEVYADGSAPIDSPVPAVAVEPSVLDKASYRRHSEGVIAVFEQHTTSLDEIVLGAQPLLVAAESVEKPGNLGAMVRAADAAGADAVVAISANTDLFNPNLIRASTGASFSVPLATASLDDLVGYCRSLSLALLVAHPEAEQSLYEIDLTGPTCILVGTEDVGVSEPALMAADLRFSIPMVGSVDSLNVSTTAAISLYEAVRQRSAR